MSLQISCDLSKSSQLSVTVIANGFHVSAHDATHSALAGACFGITHNNHLPQEFCERDAHHICCKNKGRGHNHNAEGRNLVRIRWPRYSQTPKWWQRRKMQAFSAQGCAAPSCSLKCKVPDEVGRLQHSGTNCIACISQEFQPNARQDDACPYRGRCHGSGPAINHTSSGPSNYQPLPCRNDEPDPRGAQSEVVQPSRAILCADRAGASSDLETWREAHRFRSINMYFLMVTGKRKIVTALQDTGADDNAITEKMAKTLGYVVNPLGEDERARAALGFGGELVRPQGFVNLRFWMLCDQKNLRAPETFYVYKDHALVNHQVILSAGLTKKLAHLRSHECDGGCNEV